MLKGLTMLAAGVPLFLPRQAQGVGRRRFGLDFSQEVA